MCGHVDLRTTFTDETTSRTANIKYLGQEAQDQIVEVIARHLDAFAWSASNMPGIDPNFLCHHLTMDPQNSKVCQRRRKLTNFADQHKVINCSSDCQIITREIITSEHPLVAHPRPFSPAQFGRDPPQDSHRQPGPWRLRTQRHRPHRW